jgi:hypothetical protein
VVLYLILIPFFTFSQSQANDPILVDGYSIKFPSSYKDAKREFKSLSVQIQKKFKTNYKTYATSEEDSTLQIDSLFVKNKNSNLVIVTSGLHGAEAMAGHAVQALLMKKLISADSLKSNFLFVHMLNPYGAKYFRRTNKDNVDLNRNHGDKSLFEIDNKNYIRYQNLFHSKKPVDQSKWSKLLYFMKVSYCRLIYGKKSLLEAMAGQYEDQFGTNYGGSSLAKESLVIETIIKDQSKKRYSKVYHIDLHTGYGEYGKLHLFGSNRVDAKQAQQRKKLFEGYLIDTGNDKDFYTTNGSFDDWLRKEFRSYESVVVSMVFEFGTLDSHTLWGGFESLWAFTKGNQGFHYGYKNKWSQEATEQQYEKLFNPQDYYWRKKVLEQADEVLSKSLKRFGGSL